jgi:hypothetical protein
MPNWERREADTLAEAINKHRRSKPHLVQENQQLAIIQKAADEAANTVSTTMGELTRHRASVCTICRGSKLHDCDVPHGWSDNCAFIRSNTTEFGSL